MTRQQQGTTSPVHVHPVADQVHHDTDTDQADCVCGPTVQPVRRDDGSIGWIIVHHSLDGREHAADAHQSVNNTPDEHHST